MRCLLAIAVASLSLDAQQEPPTAPVPPTPAAASPLVLGSGAFRYEWVKDWGRMPDGKDIGNTHGALVVDKQGRIFANTDAEHAVLIFSPEGKVLSSWGKEWQGGLHGMCLRVEDGVEYLYLVHTRRHEALKTTLDGKVQWTLGWPEASGIYQKEDEFNPTSIAVAPDGRIFVADGYGKSWVHLYDKDRKYVKSFGGPGTEPGKMQTCHGLLLDQRGKTPLLLVCDRANHRLQWFTLDGEYVRMLDKELRLPCNVAVLPEGGLVVADLEGRISLFDKDDKLIEHLGDNPDEKKRGKNGIERAQWHDGEFLSPHGVCVDQKGDIYVLDWNFKGRFSKLKKLAG